MSNTDKIITRLRALLEKTVENGCTEAEATAAAKKAAALMSEHNLTLAEIGQVSADEWGEVHEPINTGYRTRQHEAQFLAGEIGDLFDCKSWNLTKLCGSKYIVFFGQPADTVAASTLFKIIRAAMDREFVAWSNSGAHPYHLKPSKARPSFMFGMVERLQERLEELNRERRVDLRHRGGGRDLVVLKSQAVDDAFDALDMKLGSARTKTVEIDARIFTDGKTAGDKVGLHSGEIAD